MSDRFVLAQISDTHIRVDARKDGFDPAENLRRALKAIALFKVDAIIATGDLANDERTAEYDLLADILRDAPAPVFVGPGNHDDRAKMRAAFPDHAYLPKGEGVLSYAVDHFPVRLVMVDQIVPKEVAGLFTEEHAEWLDAALAASDKPTLVALHHPPFATQDQLLDRIGLAHAERFADVIGRHHQVKRIICGHHHRVVFGQVAHCPAVIAASTAWSFGLALTPDHPLAKRSEHGAGWMLHAWSREAGFASHFIDLNEGSPT